MMLRSASGHFAAQRSEGPRGLHTVPSPGGREPRLGGGGGDVLQAPPLRCNQAMHGDTIRGARGGGSCQVKFAVVNFAAGNVAEAPGFCVVHSADPPRNAVVCGALQALWG